MAKGKKFTAAEKHFMKKEKQYKQQIHDLHIRLGEQGDFKEKVHTLEMQLQQKDDWINRLLELTEMSKSDIEALISSGKATEKLVGMMDMFKRTGLL